MRDTKPSRFKYNQVGQRVLFIATSDDPQWLKENLRGVNNDLYFSADLFAGINPLFAVSKVFWSEIDRNLNQVARFQARERIWPCLVCATIP